MSRGIGGFDLLRGSIPEWLAVVIALLTQLGDVWFLVVFLTVCYWVRGRNREDIAAVAGIALAGMGLYLGLKELFGLPRPERSLVDPTLLPAIVRPLYEATATASGYGFPSGHAVNATIVYFGLASALSIGAKRRRYAAAGLLVALVSFTRVALGVHYVVDVVAGVALGLALLGAALWVLRRTVVDRPTTAFALGIAFCAFFFATSDGSRDATLLFAGALGAFGGWQLVVLGRGLLAAPSPRRAAPPLALRGGAAVAASAPLFVALASPSAAAGLVGFAGMIVVVLPAVRHSDRARELYSRVRNSGHSD